VRGHHLINTWEGWLYLATVIDLASRRVVGWATADHLRTDLVDQALNTAVVTRRPGGPVIFHSDRGKIRVRSSPDSPINSACACPSAVRDSAGTTR